MSELIVQVHVVDDEDGVSFTNMVSFSNRGGNYCIRFRLRGSSGSSSSARSAVSAGFSRECTLDAILERRVGGPGVSIPLNGYFAPGNVHPLSAPNAEGASFPDGGVPCLDDCCLGPRGS